MWMFYHLKYLFMLALELTVVDSEQFLSGDNVSLLSPYSFIKPVSGQCRQNLVCHFGVWLAFPEM